jgi:predicted nucleic-acid-binding protein
MDAAITAEVKAGVLAVDTNVVVGLLTDDEPAQAARARAIFEESVLLAKTVILEAEWVLRRLYRFDRSRIADAFSQLVALPAVVCEDISSITEAIGWMRGGMDFADALHFASARTAGSFATFDRQLARRAATLADVTVIPA